MASAATSRPSNSAGSRIATAASTISSDNETLMADIRKSLNIFKSVGIDLEKQGETDKVKKLDEVVLELLGKFDECALFSGALQSINNNYQSSDQPTDFRKVLEDGVAKLKASSQSGPESDRLYRQFKEAIWNVHHAGEPMPGDEQEDLVMTSTQVNVLNINCPLTGKPVVDLVNPVRCMECKHIYERDPIMHYIRRQKPQPRCPVAGCPKILQVGKVFCDPLLRGDLEELCLAETAANRHHVVEDFTELDDY
ncbi:RING/U-box superfamily protein isoform X1 [Carex rostrata]